MDKQLNTTQITMDLSVLQDLSVSTIYLMGFSFVLGSAFTVLMLLILDFMRSRHMEKTD